MNIKFQLLFLMSTFLLLFFSAKADDGKLNMPKTIKANDQQLFLNGTGIRKKFLIDLFIGGLYLKKKTSDAAKIINADEVMAIRLEVISDVITAQRLEIGMRSEFKRVANGKIKPYESRIEDLIFAFKEDVKLGDVFDLVYSPEEGLHIYKNNQHQAHIKGYDFKKMLFSIWLGSDPADKGLKDGMLGKKAV